MSHALDFDHVTKSKHFQSVHEKRSPDGSVLVFELAVDEILGPWIVQLTTGENANQPYSSEYNYISLCINHINKANGLKHLAPARSFFIHWDLMLFQTSSVNAPGTWLLILLYACSGLWSPPLSP